jgi:hypothetical protein
MADRAKRLSPEEAKTIMAGGLGDYELKVVNSFCTPLYWAVRNPDHSIGTRNGTAFFLNTGTALIGVTACHVVDGWHDSRATFHLGAAVSIWKS